MERDWPQIAVLLQKTVRACSTKPPACIFLHLQESVCVCFVNMHYDNLYASKQWVQTLLPRGNA